MNAKLQSTEFNLKSQKEWLESFQFGYFDTKTKIIASRLSRSIRFDNGKEIDLNSETLVVDLAKEVMKTSSIETNQIFAELIERLLTSAKTRQRGFRKKTRQKENNIKYITY